jgi:hypothetical protein
MLSLCLSHDGVDKAYFVDKIQTFGGLLEGERLGGRRDHGR